MVHVQQYMYIRDAQDKKKTTLMGVPNSYIALSPHHHAWSMPSPMYFSSVVAVMCATSAIGSVPTALKTTFREEDFEPWDSIASKIDVLSPETLGGVFNGSICVPCIPRDIHHLPELLESISAQTLLPLKVVIALSETSEEMSLTLQESLANRFSGFEISISWTDLIQNTAQNRNRARLTAAGQFISWFDADDLMLPERLQIIASAFASFPALDVVVHAFSHPYFRFAAPLQKVHLQLTDIMQLYISAVPGDGPFIMNMNGHHGKNCKNI